MKAILINGSPRKNWNTHQLLEACEKGLQGNGNETELIHLYDYQYTGCQSCFACKAKINTTNGICAIHDELRPVLEKIMEADFLIIGSPIYFGNLTAMTLALLERLEFPVLNYQVNPDGSRPRSLPKTKKVALVLNMNVSSDLIEEIGYREKFNAVSGNLARLLSNEACTTIYSCDTYQFSNYKLYDANMFDEKAKRKQREKQFPNDLQTCYELGKNMK